MTNRTILAFGAVAALGVIGFGGIALAQTEPPEGDDPVPPAGEMPAPPPGEMPPPPPVQGGAQPGGPHHPSGHPLAHLLIGFHGEVQTMDLDGEVLTVTYDGGEVTAASATEITLAQPDDTDAVWALDDETRVPGDDPAALVGGRAIVVDVDGDGVADMIMPGRHSHQPPAPPQPQQPPPVDEPAA